MTFWFEIVQTLVIVTFGLVLFTHIHEKHHPWWTKPKGKGKHAKERQKRDHPEGLQSDEQDASGPDGGDEGGPAGEDDGLRE